MARTRATLIAIATSYAGAAISIVKGIIFVPLYLHVLGIDLYGAYLASANVVGLLGMFDAGIGAVVQQVLAESWGQSDVARFSRSAGAGLFATAIISLAIIVGGVACAPFVPRWVGSPQQMERALSLTFVLTAIGSAGSLFLSTLLSLAAAWQRTQIAAAARLIGQLAEATCIGVGLLAGAGVIALGLGSILGMLAGLLIGAISIARHWRSLALPRPSFARGDVALLARTALPSMLSRIVLQIDANIEVTMVAALVSPAVAAVYAITDRVLKVAMGFIHPLANSVVSGLSHFVGSKGASEASRPVRELFGIWSLIVAAVLPALLAFNGDFTALWVGPANYGGLGLNAAFFLSETLGGRELLLSVVLISVGAIQLSAWMSTTEALVRLPLMYLGLRLAGPLGIPLATAAVSLVALLFYVQRVNRILQPGDEDAREIRWAGASVIALSFAAAVFEAQKLPHAHTWPQLILKGAVLGVFHASLSLLLLPAPRRALRARFAGLRPSR